MLKGKEGQNEMLDLETEDILRKIICFSKSEHFIPPSDIIKNLIEHNLITLKKISSKDDDKLVYKVEYADSLTKGKSSGINFWLVLLLILMLSPALLRKILGFIN